MSELTRRLGLGDATVIGLASMLGAGVFAVLAPAAAAAGTGLLLGLVLAGAVAWCNATSSAQLAAQYPTSGGTYVYGRERLGPWAGYVAGWCFVIGKTASCAAMALTFGAYALPGFERPLAVTAVALVTGVNLVGVSRTARAARVLVLAVLAVLALVVVAGLAAEGPAGTDPTQGMERGWSGVLEAGGLLFFAFAGYARIATLGEEVRDPRRTIPRAIGAALGIVFVAYAAVATVALLVLGAPALAASPAPLADTAAAAGWPWTSWVVRVGAAAACLGALLALLAGIARTALATARTGDLPRTFAHVDARFRVPQRAEAAVGAVVVLLVLTVDLREAIGFSSFGVLLYYLVANLAALTQHGPHRSYPRAVQLAGALGCLALAALLPRASVLAGIGVVAAGVALRAGLLTLRRRRSGAAG